MVLKPLISHVTNIVWSGRSLNVEDHKACLCFCKSTHCYELLVFKFQQYFLTTIDFDEWWNSYQSHSFPSDQFLQNMVDALSTLAGDISPPPLSVNDPDQIIQTSQVDEAPQKVYVIDFVSSFPGDVQH